MPADGASGPPPARILLLSDGYRTAGRPIEDAAAAAAAANVPVSTIAFGTDGGTVDIQGEVIPVPVDKASLGKLAEVTRGHYYEAGSVSQLNQVYRDLGSSIGYRTMPREITQWLERPAGSRDAAIRPASPVCASQNRPQPLVLVWSGG